MAALPGNVSCDRYTQKEIALRVGVSQPEVNAEIADFATSANFGDSGIFRNFEQDESEESGRRVYDDLHLRCLTSVRRQRASCS